MTLIRTSDFRIGTDEYKNFMRDYDFPIKCKMETTIREWSQIYYDMLKDKGLLMDDYTYNKIKIRQEEFLKKLLNLYLDEFKEEINERTKDDLNYTIDCTTYNMKFFNKDNKRGFENE